MEYKIINPEGNEIPRDQQGELCLKGPNIMLGTHPCTPDKLTMIGYLNNETATKEAFTPDGFLRTGDIGYFGENEYLSFSFEVINAPGIYI